MSILTEDVLLALEAVAVGTAGAARQAVRWATRQAVRWAQEALCTIHRRNKSAVSHKGGASGAVAQGTQRSCSGGDERGQNGGPT